MNEIGFFNPTKNLQTEMRKVKISLNTMRKKLISPGTISPMLVKSEKNNIECPKPKEIDTSSRYRQPTQLFGKPASGQSMQRIKHETHGKEEISESYESVAQTEIVETQDDLYSVETCNLILVLHPCHLLNKNSSRLNHNTSH